MSSETFIGLFSVSVLVGLYFFALCVWFIRCEIKRDSTKTEGQP